MLTKSSPATVGQLVREQPARSRVFESLDIDYCCGGRLSLEDACRLNGLDPAQVRRRLAECDDERRSAVDSFDLPIDVDAMDLCELVSHIEQTHHDYLKDELPRLARVTEKVARVHGDRDPRLHKLRDAFESFWDEIVPHMMKEEMVLFPMIRKMERHLEAHEVQILPTFYCVCIASPIDQMIDEHDRAGEILAEMRELTDGFVPPDWACNTYRTMLDSLRELERDMHQHIHKENNVLFPKAIELEARLEHV